jgi:hypothetical protein
MTTKPSIVGENKLKRFVHSSNKVLLLQPVKKQTLCDVLNTHPSVTETFQATANNSTADR